MEDILRHQDLRTVTVARSLDPTRAYHLAAIVWKFFSFVSNGRRRAVTKVDALDV